MSLSIIIIGFLTLSAVASTICAVMFFRNLKEKDRELKEAKEHEKDLIDKNSEQTKTIITMEQFIEIQGSILARYRNELRDDIF